MKFTLALGFLALGATLAQASISRKGPDGNRLQDPPRGPRPTEAAPGVEASPALAAPPVVRYTADSLTFILYRFAFTDKPPVRLDSIVGELEKVKRKYTEWSGGRFRFIYKIHPTVFNLRRTNAGYSNLWYDFLDEVEANLRTIGVDLDNPPKNTVLGYHSQLIYNYNSGGMDWTTNLHHMEAWAIIHELQHAVGLHHASGIEAGNRILIGNDNPADKEYVDYGNVYCNMGMGYEAHLVVVYKDFYGWISPEERWHITYPGTYRVYAHDMAERHGTIALTLPSGNGKYTYWLEYRAGTMNWMNKPGTVLFNLQGYLNKAHNHPLFWDTLSLFLDMTPNSGGTENTGWWADDWTDGGLAVGKTFTDPWGGFRVTVVGTGGPARSKYAWAEVKVENIRAPGAPAALAPEGRADREFPDSGLPLPLYNPLGRKQDIRVSPSTPVLRIGEDGKIK